MKKIVLVILALAMLISFTGCDHQPTEPSEPEKLFINSDEVDLRQVAVDYMYAMANIQWTAGTLLDYSNYSATLVYEPGKTYLGMVYNSNGNGLEAFQAVLDENNQHIGTVTGWSSAPGNSCATSIEHAWQQISPTVSYEYSVDMMPYYEDSGVLAVGDIDWSCYNGSNTGSVISGNDKNVILEAYAQVLPGDAMVRYLTNGGHALMVTKAPTVVRNEDGSINMVNSYLYLTDQNIRLHNRREYPSSWEVDRPVTFAAALADGYLPVTCAELKEGKAPVPTFEVKSAPTAEDLAKGNIKGSIKSNYCLNTVRMELRSGDQVIASVEEHPYSKTYGLKNPGKDLNIAQLSAGEYTLVVIAQVGLGTQTLLEITFSK